MTTEQPWMTVEEVAEYYGITPASARRLLSDHRIRHTRVYPTDQATTINRPGRGARTDLKGQTHV